MHTDKGKTNTQNSDQRPNESFVDCFQFPKSFFLRSVFICVDLCSSVVSLRSFTSKQAVLLAGWFETEVFIGKSGGDSAALGAVEQAELHQVGLVDFLDGVFFFAKRCRNCVESDRSAGIFLQ